MSTSPPPNVFRQCLYHPHFSINQGTPASADGQLCKFHCGHALPPGDKSMLLTPFINSYSASSPEQICKAAFKSFFFFCFPNFESKFLHSFACKSFLKWPQTGNLSRSWLQKEEGITANSRMQQPQNLHFLSTTIKHEVSSTH